jgi:hypothetical protein
MTFDEMASRYGEITAYSYLAEIERAAGISPDVVMGQDPEMRLANAHRVQDATSKAAATPTAHKPTLTMVA